MTSQKNTYTITEPIPSTREDYENFKIKKRANVTCGKFETSDGGWGCTGQCTITSDYQEACVPKVFYDQNEPGGFIGWCECVEVRNLQELIKKGDAIKSEWPNVKDFKYIFEEK